MWELVSNEDKTPLSSNIKAEFSVRYILEDTPNGDNKMYQFYFDISDYQVRHTNVICLLQNFLCLYELLCSMFYFLLDTNLIYHILSNLQCAVNLNV